MPKHCNTYEHTYMCAVHIVLQCLIFMKNFQKIIKHLIKPRFSWFFCHPVIIHLPLKIIKQKGSQNSRLIKDYPVFNKKNTNF